MLCMCSREFSHRIKSISMAKFNAAEVAALQAGGNEVHPRGILWQLEYCDYVGLVGRSEAVC